MKSSRVCNKIPCEILSDRVLVHFFNKLKHLDQIKQLLSYIDSRKDIPLELNEIEKLIVDLFLDNRYLKYILKALRYFYELKKPQPEDFGFDSKFNLSFEDIRRDFYIWLNSTHGGFIIREKRGEIIKEFANSRKIPIDIVNKALSYVDTTHVIFKVKREFSYEDFLGLVNYYIILSLVSKSRELHLNLKGAIGGPIKKFIYVAKKLGVLDSASITARDDSVKIILSLAETEFADSRIVIGSHKLAYLIAMLISETRSGDLSWIIKCFFPSDKSLFFSLRSDSYWLPLIKTPIVLKGNKTIYDSRLEESLFRELTSIAKNYHVYREADIVVLDNKTIMIPDFTIVCGDKKIFIELIGYWRREYLENKRRKLNKIPSNTPLILFLTDRNWPLIGNRFPKIKITSKGKLLDPWKERFVELIRELCDS